MAATWADPASKIAVGGAGSEREKFNSTMKREILRKKTSEIRDVKGEETYDDCYPLRLDKYLPVNHRPLRIDDQTDC